MPTDGGSNCPVCGIGLYLCWALVETTTGKWITRPPARCPNGHTLGPNQVLVGHMACLGHGGGGHTSWHCRTCDAVVYGAPMAAHCSALDEPATVRLPSREGLDPHGQRAKSLPVHGYWRT